MFLKAGTVGLFPKVGYITRERQSIETLQRLMCMGRTKKIILAETCWEVYFGGYSM